jgi:hypothetical protein
VTVQVSPAPVCLHVVKIRLQSEGFRYLADNIG